MNVLSLFDGISTGRVALSRAGIPVTSYYASEIDKYAIEVAKKRNDKLIPLGNVKNWRNWSIDLGSIDLLLAGSPCQGFSIAGKGLNFEDPRSKLFFEFADILQRIRESNPKILFLLENVKMKKEHSKIITGILGVEPMEINSGLLSAQSRKRLYWTNIKGVEPPKDKGILLKDIVHEHTEAIEDPELMKRLQNYKVPLDKTLRIIEKEVQKGKIGYFRTDSQANRVYSIHGKAVTLLGEAGGGAAKMGQYLFGCITPDRENKRQNGQRFNTGDKFYTLTAQDQHGILIDGYIRKLTPTECERLQTLPDGYTEVIFEGKQISDTQRYKMLGNGWTADIIAHILSYIHKERV